MIIDVFRGLAPCPDDAAMDGGDANDVDTNADEFAVGLNLLPDAKGKGKRMLPDGLDRRSSCHMHMLREAKRVKGVDDAQVQMREDLAKLGSGTRQLAFVVAIWSLMVRMTSKDYSPASGR